MGGRSESDGLCGGEEGWVGRGGKEGSRGGRAEQCAQSMLGDITIRGIL